MLRMLSLLVLGSSSLTLAQVPTAPSVSLPPAEAAGSDNAPVEPDVVPEEPKMKKVCRPVEVVGSSIPRRICSMKPLREHKLPNVQ